MRLHLRFFLLEAGAASIDGSSYSDSPPPYSDSMLDTEQSELSDHSLSDRAGGRETGLAGGDEDDRDTGLEVGGRATGLEGGDGDGNMMDNHETSMLLSDTIGVRGEDGREVGDGMGELCGESIPASSSSRAALMAGRKECFVTSFSNGPNIENSRPVRVYSYM